MEEIINPEGGGNGMMMKQFALAAYFSAKTYAPELEEKTVRDISKVSHAHPASLVAAITHHKFLKILLQSDPQHFNKKEILQKLKVIAEKEENNYPYREGKKISEILTQISSYISEDNKFSLDDKQILDHFGWK